MAKFKKGLLFSAGLLLIGNLLAPCVSALEYDRQYNYIEDKTAIARPVKTPDVFEETACISGAQLVPDGFSDPKDIYVSGNQIYVLDSGHNRVVICNDQFQLIRVVDSFERDGAADTFSNPQGIYVDADQNLYVADTDNERVVVLDSKDAFVREIRASEKMLLRSGSKFAPHSVAADRNGSVYALSKTIYEGILEFDAQGEFKGFVGAANARSTLWVRLLKKIMPKEMAEGLIKATPSEYAALDMDAKGFLYPVSSMKTQQMSPVKQLNTFGVDILKTEGLALPIGDITNYYSNPSVFIDICVSQNRTYSMLDTTMGRIFTYDFDGNLLAVFGGKEETVSSFYNPTAITAWGNRLLVLDEALGNFTVFSPSKYGAYIFEALDAFSAGDYEASYQNWQEVLDRNLYCEMAYSGIGKVKLLQKDYTEAMRYFELGRNPKMYSKALTKASQQRQEQYFFLYAFGIVAAVALVCGFFYATARYNRREKDGTLSRLCYGNYTVLHPVKAFWDIRFHSKASVVSASILLGVYVAVQLLTRQFTGFVFVTWEPLKTNVLVDVLVPVGLVMLFTGTNWVASMMFDGIGRFKDIYICICYSMLPLIYTDIAKLVLSNILTYEDKAIYAVVGGIGLLWSTFMVITWNAIFHDYRISKGMATLFLTLVIVAVVLFLFLLFVSMLGQLLGFSSSIWNELYMKT